jgi:hypothetical protein
VLPLVGYVVLIASELQLYPLPLNINLEDPEKVVAEVHVVT